MGYNQCTWTSAHLTEHKPWCSTEVDDTGHHVGGQGKWGNCGPNCPIPPDDRPSPPTPPGAPVTPPTCPPGHFGTPPHCSCYEDNTAYFGNNARVGSSNPQPSMRA